MDRYPSKIQKLAGIFIEVKQKRSIPGFLRHFYQSDLKLTTMTYKPLKNPADAYLVHLHEEWEIIYWCKKFNCKRQDLELAVKTVGNSPDQIWAYLQRRADHHREAS